MNQTCLNNTDWALEKNWKIKKKIRKQVSGQKQEQRNEKNRCRNWYRVSWSNQSLTRSRVSPRLYPRISVMVRPIVLRITVDARQKHSYLVCPRTKSRWRVYQKKFYLSGSWGRRSVRLFCRQVSLHSMLIIYNQNWKQTQEDWSNRTDISPNARHIDA